MIISKRYALKLVKNGKACNKGIVKHNGDDYVVLDRYDNLRTDHYKL